MFLRSLTQYKYLVLMSNITGHCRLLLITDSKNSKVKHIQYIQCIIFRYSRENEEILYKEKYLLGSINWMY